MGNFILNPIFAVRKCTFSSMGNLIRITIFPCGHTRASPGWAHFEWPFCDRLSEEYGA